MLKTASELRISEEEHDTLIKVLGMLERGELKLADETDEGNYLFNMGTQGGGCGTPACIGGWVAALMQVHQATYVNHQEHNARPLYELYWGYINPHTTVKQAAMAVRNFLTVGDPCWEQIVN